MTDQLISNDLQGRVALITGASGGVGYAVAQAFVQAGAAVVLVARRSQLLDRFTSEWKATGARILVCNEDIMLPAAPQLLVDRAVSQFGYVDVLVNCAGVFVHRPFLELSEDDVQNTMAVNLLAPFRLTQAVAARLIEQKRPGSVINIGSVHGSVGDANAVAQCMSKFGLEGLTRSAAEALRSANIRVNAIAPGSIAADSATSHSKTLNERVSQADIARLAVYLASDAARFLTGTTVNAYGVTRPTIFADVV